jgi:hypothetical protein
VYAGQSLSLAQPLLQVKPDCERAAEVGMSVCRRTIRRTDSEAKATGTRTRIVLRYFF